MAIEKVITIASSEVKAGKSGKSYLEVIDQDNDKYSCWEEGLWNSLGKNATGTVSFEKKGIFRNITAFETAEEGIAKISPKPPDTPAPEPLPPKKWQADGKNKAFALSYAKDLAVADKITGSQIIFTAEMFNQYLSGNITVPEEVIIKLVQQQVKAKLTPKE